MTQLLPEQCSDAALVEAVASALAGKGSTEVVSAMLGEICYRHDKLRSDRPEHPLEPMPLVELLWQLDKMGALFGTAYGHPVMSHLAKEAARWMRLYAGASGCRHGLVLLPHEGCIRCDEEAREPFPPTPRDLALAVALDALRRLGAHGCDADGTIAVAAVHGIEDALSGGLLAVHAKSEGRS